MAILQPVQQKRLKMRRTGIAKSIDWSRIPDMTTTAPKRKPGRPRTGGADPTRPIRVPDELFYRACSIAARRGITYSDFAREAIADAVERDQRAAECGDQREVHPDCLGQGRRVRASGG